MVTGMPLSGNGDANGAVQVIVTEASAASIPDIIRWGGERKALDTLPTQMYLFDILHFTL